MTTERHLTSEELDLLELDALQGEERAFAERHLETCERCGGLRAELRADTAHFRQFVMPRTLERVTRPRPARPAALRWLSFAAGAAVLVLAALVARPLLLAGGDDGPYVGVRGEPVFRVVAARGETQTELAPDTVLRGGDRLRFIVDPVKPGYVLVISRDPAGAFTVYAPFGGTRSLEVAAGTRTLPDTVELDATTGREHLLAVFSDAPLEARAVIAALSAARWPPEGRLELPGARAVQRVTFEKR